MTGLGDAIIQPQYRWNLPDELVKVDFGGISFDTWPQEGTLAFDGEAATPFTITPLTLEFIPDAQETVTDFIKAWKKMIQDSDDMRVRKAWDIYSHFYPFRADVPFFEGVGSIIGGRRYTILADNQTFRVGFTTRSERDRFVALHRDKGVRKARK